jgi:fatty acid-binding protein DegV
LTVHSFYIIYARFKLKTNTRKEIFMSKIGIVVDSPADFPEGMAEKLGLHIMPVHIYVNGRDHLHGVDISNREVVDHLRYQKDVSTKPFFPGECADVFERLTNRYDKIFSFHVSSQLSGCFESEKKCGKSIARE